MKCDKQCDNEILIQIKDNVRLCELSTPFFVLMKIQGCHPRHAKPGQQLILQQQIYRQVIFGEKNVNAICAGSIFRMRMFFLKSICPLPHHLYTASLALQQRVDNW